MSTDNIGGVWTYTMNLAEGLRNNGVDVFIAVTGNNLSASQQEMIRSFNYEVILTRQEWMNDPWEDIEKASLRLNSIANLVRPDIVHLNSFSYNSHKWNVPVIVVAHSCVLSWWDTVLGEPVPYSWNRYKEQVSYGITNADVVVAPSHSMMDMVKKYYKPASSEVIYNGADPDIFFPTGKEDIVFSMGRLWDKAKNISLLLEAAHEINYPVFIAGNYDDIQNIRVPGNVTFTGYLNNSLVRGYLSRAAVYALPVKYEPFGYTFLEAALSGCALVAGDIPSMRELWGDSAIYSPTNNSTILAEQINALMADKQKRQRLSDMARERATMNYSLENMTRGYLKLYAGILKSAFHNKNKIEV